MCHRKDVGGVATLERPRVEPSVVSVRSAPLIDHRVRTALVLATFAAAAFALAGVTPLVGAYSWSVSPLGGAQVYAVDAPTALAWLLVAGALAAVLGVAAGWSRGGGATGPVRLGIAGAVVSAIGAGAGLWGDALQSSTLPKTPHTLYDALSRLAPGLGAVGHALFAVALLAAWRVATRDTAGRPTWGPTCLAAALGVLCVAIQLGVTAATREWGALRSEQLAEVLTRGADTLGWLLLAAAGWLAAGVLRAGRRTRALTAASPVAALAAIALAVATAASLAYDELSLHGTAATWLPRLSELSSVAQWAGWVVFAVAFGVAAIRLTDTA